MSDTDRLALLEAQLADERAKNQRLVAELASAVGKVGIFVGWKAPIILPRRLGDLWGCWFAFADDELRTKHHALSCDPRMKPGDVCVVSRPAIGQVRLWLAGPHGADIPTDADYKEFGAGEEPAPRPKQDERR